MKNTVRLVSSLVLALCLSACYETVSLKDLGVKPKLVLYCFLSPQYDTISVYLTNSQPLFSIVKSVSEINLATVEISNDNQNWTQIPYNKASKRYLLPQSQFPITEGKTYYIRASAANYESISASCIVPFWREINLMPEGISASSPRDGFSWPILSFSWNDYRGENNYYAFISYGRPWWDDSYSRLESKYMNEEDSKVVISDEGKDGEKISVSTTIWESGYSAEWITSEDNQLYDSVYILAIQTDKHTFLFENSVASYDGMGFISIFTIEPTLIYSNIKNGYGVFGAMTFKSYRANFRQKTIEEAEYQKPEPPEEMKRRK